MKKLITLSLVASSLLLCNFSAQAMCSKNTTMNTFLKRCEPNGTPLVGCNTAARCSQALKAFTAKVNAEIESLGKELASTKTSAQLKAQLAKEVSQLKNNQMNFDATNATLTSYNVTPLPANPTPAQIQQAERELLVRMFIKTNPNNASWHYKYSTDPHTNWWAASVLNGPNPNAGKGAYNSPGYNAYVKNAMNRAISKNPSLKNQYNNALNKIQNYDLAKQAVNQSKARIILYQHAITHRKALNAAADRAGESNYRENSNTRCDASDPNCRR